MFLDSITLELAVRAGSSSLGRSNGHSRLVARSCFRVVGALEVAARACFGVGGALELTGRACFGVAGAVEMAVRARFGFPEALKWAARELATARPRWGARLDHTEPNENERGGLDSEPTRRRHAG